MTVRSCCMAIALLAASGFAPALAQQAQTEGRVQNECWPRFAEFDRNADKVIDADELGVDKARIFRVLDRDADGALAKEEFLGCLAVSGPDAAVIQERFASLDKDHDGRLTLPEFTIEGGSAWADLSVPQQKSH